MKLIEISGFLVQEGRPFLWVFLPLALVSCHDISFTEEMLRLLPDVFPSFLTIEGGYSQDVTGGITLQKRKVRDC
jgi:hypothetical protein